MNPDCDSPHPGDLGKDCPDGRPIGYTKDTEYVSATSVGGTLMKARGYGHGSSTESQAEADAEALEAAKEHAARLLRLKINVLAYTESVWERARFQTGFGLAFDRLAPFGTRDLSRPWEGAIVKKPSEYQVTTMIPHLNSIEPLAMCIEMLRSQTIQPFIVVVDTGSPKHVCDALEVMRSDSIDLDIHYIRSASFQHSSEPVTAAMDLAQSLCATPYMFFTHTDCFLRRFDFLEHEIMMCDAKHPVAGYRMSPRDWVTDEWSFMVGHTATMIHVPTIHKVGAVWSMSRMHNQYGISYESRGGWPDTEVCFNKNLRDAGIRPIFIGHDTNYERFVDSNLDHSRSHLGSMIYAPKYFRNKASRWIRAAMKDGQARIDKARADATKLLVSR